MTMVTVSLEQPPETLSTFFDLPTGTIQGIFSFLPFNEVDEDHARIFYPSNEVNALCPV